jgi:hypothetical protein
MVVLFFIAWRLRKKLHEEQIKVHNCQQASYNLSVTTEKKLRDLNNLIATAYVPVQTLAAANQKTQALQGQLANAANYLEQERRAAWLRQLGTMQYGSEIEVEVKFVHHFVRYLGWYDDFVSLRYPVQFSMGREVATKQADWVIWLLDNNGGHAAAHIIIEAKPPTQPLDKPVIDQARSYAFGLSAPYYVLANGRQLRVFERGVLADKELLNASVNNLAAHWDYLERTIGVRGL